MPDLKTTELAELEQLLHELRNERDLLRAALARISAERRTDYPSGFAYELAVRRTADGALGRELV